MLAGTYIIVKNQRKKYMMENSTVENLTENVKIDLYSDEGLASLDLFAEYSSEVLNFAAISCIIFMLVGIPGNLITIISLALYRKVRNATAIFIINMSIADLLFACINLPLAISTFWTRKWLHGLFVCQFFVFARFALSGVAVFTVLAITINRYIMISHPTLYTKLYTSRNLGIQLACMWVGAVVSLIPTWAGAWGCFGMDLQSSFCVIKPDANGQSPQKLLFVCAFAIPFIAICFCYGRIFYIVRKTTAKSRGTNRRQNIEKDESSFPTSTGERSPDSDSDRVQTRNPPEHPRVQSLRPLTATTRPKVSIIVPDPISSAPSISNFARSIQLRKSQLLNIAPTSKDKKLLTMITAIMVAFFVFHLPITIMKVSSEVISFHPQAIIWSYLLRYLTTCINPIIYVVMSHEYRKAYKKVIVLKSCENKFCLPR